MNSIFDLTCCNKIDPIIWDKLATELGGRFFHCHASIVYRSELTGDEPIFFEARDKENHCVGIAAGTIATSKIWPLSKYCRIASFPSTPIAGGNQDTEKWILKNIEKQLRRLGVFRIEFASYHSLNSKDLLPSFGYEIDYRHEYEFDLTRDLDDLFKAILKKKRRLLRKAKKLGVITREVNSFEAVQLVEDFHNISMERRGLSHSKMDQRSITALKTLFESMRIRVLISYLKDEPVCGDLLGVFNGRAYGLRSGSSDLGNQNYAPAHLRWTAINILKDQGFTSYNLGGARQEESGLRKFKQEFGTIEIYQPSGVKIFSGIGSFLAMCRRFVSRR